MRILRIFTAQKAQLAYATHIPSKAMRSNRSSMVLIYRRNAVMSTQHIGLVIALQAQCYNEITIS